MSTRPGPTVVAAIGLYGGREDNRIFRGFPGGGLETRRTTTLLGGDTILLGDDTIHAVANPSQEWTGAIHVYGGDYFQSDRRMWLDVEGSATPFDVARLEGVLDDAARAAKTRETAEQRMDS